MPNDASKLSIPLLIALSAVIPLVTLGAVYGTQSSRVSAVEYGIERLQKKQEQIDAMALQIARMETKLDFLVNDKKQNKP